VYAEGAQGKAFSGLLYGYSDRVATQSFLANALWCLGYPEQAAAAACQALARARATGHAAMTAIALLGKAVLADLGADPDGTAPYAEEMLTHCIEHDLANYEHLARYQVGAQLVRRGDPRRGIELMQAALAAITALNARVFRPLHLGRLAAAHAAVAEPEIGLGLVNEALTTAAQSAERFLEAELFRVRGTLLEALGRPAEAEGEFERALAIAHRQRARLWELRAALALARLPGAGRAQARRRLRSVYEWFSEGHDFPDLKEARAQLSVLDA
jgi:tetratricopeptide (TPR) repeat protein